MSGAWNLSGRLLPGEDPDDFHPSCVSKGDGEVHVLDTTPAV